jgi:hypothetical protein
VVGRPDVEAPVLLARIGWAGRLRRARLLSLVGLPRGSHPGTEPETKLKEGKASCDLDEGG